MRISAIAQEAISRDIDSFFVGEIEQLPWVNAYVNNLGFTGVFRTLSELSSLNTTDILFIDSYTLAEIDPWIQPARWRYVVSIFDEETPCFKSHLSIHPGLSIFNSRTNCKKTLSGPHYFPLRKSISTSESTVISSDRLKITVSGGGSDMTGFVPAIASALRNTNADFSADVFTNRPQMVLDERFTLHSIGSRLDEISKYSELVFTTASTSSLEFIARGAAVGIGCAARNQVSYYENLSSKSFAEPVGRIVDNVWKLEFDAIDNLLSSDSYRTKLRKNAKNLVDINGAKRIIDEVLRLE